MPTEIKTQEEHKNAIAAAKKAVQDDPTDFKRHERLGWAYFDAARYAEAMTAFQRVIELDPNAAPAYNAIGRVCERTGQPEKAVKAYQRAIALDLQYVPPYYGLGIMYAFELGKYDAGLGAFQHALEHNPTDGFLVANIGNTYARMGRIDEAVASLQEAVRLEPDSTYGLSNLSTMYLYLRRYDDVIAVCRREIEVKDGNDPRRMLGYAYDRMGRSSEAMAELERALAFNPDDYEVRAALSKLYCLAGREGEAQEHLTRADEESEQEAEYGHASVASVSGDVERALALLKIALGKGQLEPGWARIDPEFAFIKDDPRFQALIEG